MNATILRGYQLYIEGEARKKKIADESRKVFLFGLAFFVVGFITVMLIMLILSIWNYIKSWRVGPITKTPGVPFSSRYLRKKYHPNKGIRFYCGFVSDDKPNTNRMIAKMMKALKIEKKSDFPSDARKISVKMEGFKFGSDCQRFEPMDGMGPGSYYTYQMFGDKRIQVTNYVEGGTSYVAGFCIYIKRGSIPADVFCYRVAVIKQLMKSLKYKCTRPIVERKTIPAKSILRSTEDEAIRIEREAIALLEEVDPENWCVKRCSELERNVMTTVIDGSAYHQEWNTILRKMKNLKCIECSENVKQDLHPPRYSSLSIV